jgi:hypothetical protein
VANKGRSHGIVRTGQRQYGTYAHPETVARSGTNAAVAALKPCPANAWQRERRIPPIHLYALPSSFFTNLLTGRGMSILILTIISHFLLDL